jgi:uncharacterized protein
VQSLSAREARRVALAAQGLPRKRRAARVSAASVLDAVRRQGLLQIDSVNVLARAHYMPLFSRLGSYDTTLLDRVAYGDKQLYEGWSHAASLLPVELWPLHEWRRRQHDRDWQKYVNKERMAYFDSVLDEVRERGPIAAGELSDPRPKRGGGKWFDRSAGKSALEYHFGGGRVAVADRRSFERVYDLAERVIPAEYFVAPPMEEDEARRALVLHATRLLGVGSVDDIADYFRLKLTSTRQVIKALVADGDLVEVEVEGWGVPAYMPAKTRVPRSVDGHALFNPFDPIVWHRPRTERLFDFHYRIEIYVPAPKRIHGYYVLPFIVGDAFAARVDLKADRQARVLRVFSAWLEPPADESGTAVALAEELRLMARWLDLDGIDVAAKGDLASGLIAELAR